MTIIGPRRVARTVNPTTRESDTWLQIVQHDREYDPSYTRVSGCFLLTTIEDCPINPPTAESPAAIG